MRFLLAVLIVSAATIAAAQENPENKAPAASPAASAAPSPEARRGIRPGDVQKVFVIQHLLVSDLARVLSVFPAELSGRDSMRVLSVSAAPAVVAAIEETIKRLDVPPPPIKSVEITAYVLECSTSGEAGTLSPDLQGVLVQLKKTFNYSGCALARTLIARGSDDSRFAGEFNERAAGRYELSGRVQVDSNDPPTVRVRGIELVTWSAGARSRISGDIEVRGGQKVVLGRLGVSESGKDQIVVLTAKVAP
jgi:hypothetical protein